MELNQKAYSQAACLIPMLPEPTASFSDVFMALYCEPKPLLIMAGNAA